MGLEIKPSAAAHGHVIGAEFDAVEGYARALDAVAGVGLAEGTGDGEGEIRDLHKAEDQGS